MEMESLMRMKGYGDSDNDGIPDYLDNIQSLTLLLLEQVVRLFSPLLEPQLYWVTLPLQMVTTRWVSMRKM
jgi:hypothetical protein